MHSKKFHTILAVVVWFCNCLPSLEMVFKYYPFASIYLPVLRTLTDFCPIVCFAFLHKLPSVFRGILSTHPCQETVRMTSFTFSTDVEAEAQPSSKPMIKVLIYLQTVLSQSKTLFWGNYATELRKVSYK